MMSTFRNIKSKDKSDNDDAAYVQEVLRSNNLLDDTADTNETLNPNLDSDDSGSDDLDDICTSISQKPVNPLYEENSSSVRKIALPQASLVEDDRFWREQVNRPNEIASKMREAQNEIQDQQIFTLASSSTSSPDTFTPYKTTKDRIPDAITRWSVSLLHENLLISGYDKDGKNPRKRVCNKRISSYIFCDLNGIVCSLLGPSEVDKNVPKYILEKFKMGIPEDWQIIIQYWRHYHSVNCPVKYNWPALPHSSRFDLTTNWYEVPDSDTSYLQARNVSLTVQTLSKKIAKMQMMLRNTILKESLSQSATMKSALINSTRNNSLSNRQVPNFVDSILSQKMVANNVNRVANSNLNSASKVQNVNISSNNSNLVRQANRFEKMASESEESETEVDEMNDNLSSNSFHLEPLVSENSSAKIPAINENHRNENSDIFSSTENKKLSEDVTTGQKVSMNNAPDPNISVSSRGRTRISTLPFWKGSRLVVEKDSTKLISSQNNSTKVLNDSDAFRKLGDIETIKKRNRKNKAELEPVQSSPKESRDLVQNKNNSKEYLKPSEINTVIKRDKKNKSKVENSQLETNQEKSYSESSLKELVINVKKIDDNEFFKSQNINTKQSRNKAYNKSEEGTNIINTVEFLKPFDTEIINKRSRRKGLNNSVRTSSESPEISIGTVVSNTPDSKILEKSTEIPIQNIVVPVELVKSPIKKENRKKDWNKSQCEVTQKEVTEIAPNEFLKPPDINTIKNNRSRKKATTNNNESANVSDVSGNSMSLQSSKILRNTESSIKASTELSEHSNSTFSSMNSSVSSRGRQRVSTLPFWQGHRMTTYKEEVIIEKSTTLRCTLENYVNDDSCSNSTINNSLTKEKSNESNTASPLLSYQDVFNKYVSKKPGPKSKTKSSLINMQLMSTLRESIVDDTINKSNLYTQSTSRINSPFNNVVNNNKAKSIANNSSPNRSSFVTDISTKANNPKKKTCSPPRNNITSQQSTVETKDISVTNDKLTRTNINREQSPVKKNTSKQFQQQKNAETNDTNKTNENLVGNQSPVRKSIRKTNNETVKNNIINQEQSPVKKNLSKQFQQLKNAETKDTNATNENLVGNQSPVRKSTRKTNNETVKNNIINREQSPVKKNLSKQFQQLKNAETNENLVRNQSPVRKSTRKTNNESVKNNIINREQSPVKKNLSKQFQQLKNAETKDTNETNENLVRNQSPVRKSTRKTNNESTINNLNREQSPKQFQQLKNTESNENLVRKDTEKTKDKPPTRKNIQEQAIVNKNTPKQFQQLKNTTEEINLTPINSTLRPRTRFVTKKENERYQLINHILGDKNNLTPKEAVVKKRTRSTKKSVEEINKLLKNNTPVPLKINNENKTIAVQEKNKLSKVENIPKVIITESSTPQNIRKKIKRNHSNCPQVVVETSETKITPKRRSRRSNLNVNYNESIKKIYSENSLVKNKSLSLQQKYKSPSAKKLFNLSRTPKLRPKKYTAENNFNFTVENISHIEDNIPNKRNIRENKNESTSLRPKQTTQFKVPKKVNYKKMVLPKDPNELDLLVNRSKKSKKKAPEVTKVPEIIIEKTPNSKPKKRKLFLDQDWMNSQYFEHVSQNNSSDNSPKFVLTIDPVSQSHEFDVISEVSALI